METSGRARWSTTPGHDDDGIGTNHHEARFAINLTRTCLRFRWKRATAARCANFVDAVHGLVRNGCGISCRCASRTPLGFRWSYDEDGRVGANGYTIVSPYESEEGIAYGEGRGTATGRIDGTVVWSNYPRRRTDGRMLPNVRGLITTQDGASILRGRTIFEGDEPGRQNFVGWFESDHESSVSERPRLHRRGRDLGDKAGYGDQRLRRHLRDVGAAQLPLSAPACPAPEQIHSPTGHMGPFGVLGG